MKIDKRKMDKIIGGDQCAICTETAEGIAIGECVLTDGDRNLTVSITRQLFLYKESLTAHDAVCCGFFSVQEMQEAVETERVVISYFTILPVVTVRQLLINSSIDMACKWRLVDETTDKTLATEVNELSVEFKKRQINRIDTSDDVLILYCR